MGVPFQLLEDIKMTSKKLLYQIQNYTESCNARQLQEGYQTGLVKTDALGVIYGSSFDRLDMKGDETPALRIPLTDTELWVDGTGFVIEFVVKREIVAENRLLLSAETLSKGMRLFTNYSSDDDLTMLQLYEDGSYKQVVSNIDDENYHGIIIEVTPTHMTMIVDGVAGTPVEHSFVPSGLRFDASTQLGPKGQLGMFKMWYGDNYKNYNREKSAKDAEEVKDLLEDSSLDFSNKYNSQYIGIL